MRRRFTKLVLSFLLLLATTAKAQQVKDYAGTWIMHLGSRNFIVLTLTIDEGQIHGSWELPEHYSSIYEAYFKIGKTIRHYHVQKAHVESGKLHFLIVEERNPEGKEAYAMSIDGTLATLTQEDLPPGLPASSLPFEKVSSKEQVATDWEPNRLYTQNDRDTDNPEMKSLFEEDQGVRQSPQIDWKQVARADAERREQTRKLLASGALHTGIDYEKAAFIFQHGDSSDDYLLAHTLAMVAVSKGDSSAIWIATATLDRYLQKIGQKQIFGTQYLAGQDRKWTQEPYDRSLISDDLRRQMGVPNQASQAKQLKSYQNQK